MPNRGQSYCITRWPIEGWACRVSLVLGLVWSGANPAWTEDVTLTTFYPAPRGVYNELRTNGPISIGTVKSPGLLGIGGTLVNPTGMVCPGGSAPEDVNSNGTVPEAGECRQWFLSVQPGGAILASGTTGTTPASGGGTRLMWIPAKGAFRAGTITGSEWDDANIGLYSFAAGDTLTASGFTSTALGLLTTASGTGSFAQGMLTKATRSGAIAMGLAVEANADFSIALGRGVNSAWPINNTISHSLMVGFFSNVPTLFVGPSAGIGTIGRIGIGTTAPSGTIGLDGAAARSILMERNTVANGAGNNLTIGAGGATAGAVNRNGGSLILQSGSSTGSGSSQISLWTSSPGTGLSEKVTILGDQRVGFWTANPTDSIALGGQAIRSIAMGQNAGANQPGNDLFVRAGSPTPGAINRNGGTLHLQSGRGTGTGTSRIAFWTDTSAVGLTEKMTIMGDGRVGIGTAAPAGTLHVKRSDANNDFIWPLGYFVLQRTAGGGPLGDGFGPGVGLRIQSASGTENTIASIAAVRDGSDTSGQLMLGTASAGVLNTGRLVISRTGKVGIGMVPRPGNFSLFQSAGAVEVIGDNTTPGGVSYYLTNASSPVSFWQQTHESTGDLTWWIPSGAVILPRMTIFRTGNFRIEGPVAEKVGGTVLWSVISDARVKKNIEPLEGSLEKMVRLRGVQFEWKEPEKHGGLSGPQMGMIAQEVEQVFPEWIQENAEGYKLLSMTGFEAVTVESLKALKAQNDALKSRVDSLEAIVKGLEQRTEGQAHGP